MVPSALPLSASVDHVFGPPEALSVTEGVPLEPGNSETATMIESPTGTACVTVTVILDAGVPTEPLPK